MISISYCKINSDIDAEGNRIWLASLYENGRRLTLTGFDSLAKAISYCNKMLKG